MQSPDISEAERLILKNQYAILEFLSRAFPNIAERGDNIYHDPEVYAWYQDILANGSPTLTDDIFASLDDRDLTRQDESEILDILNMYRHIQVSFSNLDDTQNLTKKDVKFPGWDGHRSELSFARTFCFRSRHAEYSPNPEPDRFAMIEPSPAYDSHWPTMGLYRAMLAVYEPIKNQALNRRNFDMTLDEIMLVLNAKAR